MAGTNILVRQKDLIAGSGISITPDTTSGNVTIAATNTAIDEARLLPTGGRNGNLLEYQEGVDRGNNTDTKLLIQPATSDGLIVDQAAGNAAPVSITNSGNVVIEDNALVFTGTNSLLIPANALGMTLGGNNEFTIDIEFQLDSVKSDYATLYGSDGGGDGYQGALYFTSGGAAQFTMDLGPRTTGWTLGTKHRITIERWNDNGTWKTSVYRNGSFLASSTSGMNTLSDYVFPIGSNTDSTGRNFVGKIWAFRISNKAEHRGVSFTPLELPFLPPAGQPVWVDGIDRSRLLPENPANGDIPCFDATATVGGGNDANTRLLLQPSTSDHGIVDQAAGNAAPVTLENHNVTVDEEGNMVFDGSNAYLKIPANTLPSDFFNGTDEWTLDIVYNVASKGMQCLFGCSSSLRMDFLLDSDGSLQIGAGPNLGTGWPFNEDVHLTFEIYKDGTVWKYTIFRNGSVVTTGTWVNADWRSVAQYVGWEGESDSRKINGKIKALRLTSGALHKGAAFQSDYPWTRPQTVGEWSKLNKSELVRSVNGVVPDELGNVDTPSIDESRLLPETGSVSSDSVGNPVIFKAISRIDNTYWLCLPLNEDTNDRSTYDVATGVYGTVNIVSNAPSSPGGSAFFNGSSCLHGTLPAQFGSGDFTVRFWMMAPTISSSSSSQTIFSTRYGDQTDASTFALLCTTEGRLFIYSNGDITSRTDTPFTLQPSVWYHVAVVRKSGVLTIYVNGEVYNSATFTNSLTRQIFGFGASWTGSSYSEAGTVYLTSLDVLNYAAYDGAFTTPAYQPGILAGMGYAVATDSEVTDMLSAAGIDESRLLPALDSVPVDRSGNPVVFKAISAGTDEHTLLYCPFDADMNDHSNAGGQFVQTGQKSESIVTNEKKFGSGCLNCGSGYSFLNGPLAKPVGDVDCTIHFWANITSFTGKSPFTLLTAAIPDDSNATSNFGQAAIGCLQLYVSNDLLLLERRTSSNGQTVRIIEASVSLTTGAWNHFAITRSGNIWYLFLNGQLLGTGSDTNVASATHIRIGGDSSAMSGYVDEFLVLDYAKWITDFEPPTQPASVVIKSYEVSDKGAGAVKSVNGQLPDESGNVTVETGSTVDESRLLPTGAKDGDLLIKSAEIVGNDYNDSHTVLFIQGSAANAAAADSPLPVTWNNQPAVQEDNTLLLTGSTQLSTASAPEVKRVFGGEFTVEAYLKPTQFNNTSRQDTNFFYLNGPSTYYIYLSNYNNSGNAENGKFGLWAYSGNRQITLSNGEFHHVALDVYMEGSTRKYTIYYDGVAVQTDTWYNDGVADSTNAIIRFFSSSGEAELNNCYLKSIRVSDIARYKGKSFTPPANGLYLPAPDGEWVTINRSNFVEQTDHKLNPEPTTVDEAKYGFSPALKKDVETETFAYEMPSKANDVPADSTLQLNDSGTPVFVEAEKVLLSDAKSTKLNQLDVTRQLPASPADNVTPVYKKQDVIGAMYNDSKVVVLLQGSKVNIAKNAAFQLTGGDEVAVDGDGNLVFNRGNGIIVPAGKFNNENNGQFTFDIMVAVDQLPSSTGSYEYILGNDNSPTYPFNYRVFGDGTVRFQYQNTSHNIQIEQGIFTLLSFDYDGTTLRSYKDGVLVGAQDMTYSAFPNSIGIGTDQYYSHTGFAGRIKYIRMSNIARYRGQAFTAPGLAGYVTPPDGEWVTMPAIGDNRLLPNNPTNGDIPVYTNDFDRSNFNTTDTVCLLQNAGVNQFENVAKGKIGGSRISNYAGSVTIDENGYFVYPGGSGTWIEFIDSGWNANGTGDWTLDVRMIAEATGSSQYFLGPANDGSGDPQAVIRGSGTTGTIRPYEISDMIHDITFGEEFTYSMAWEAATKTLRTWKDGKQMRKKTFSNNGYQFGFKGATEFWLGRNAVDPGLNGKVKYWRLSNAALYGDNEFTPPTDVYQDAPDGAWELVNKSELGGSGDVDESRLLPELATIPEELSGHPVVYDYQSGIDADTLCLLHLDDSTWADATGKNTITQHGSVAKVSDSGYFNKALDLSGNQSSGSLSWLTVPWLAEYEAATWTMEFFAKPTKSVVNFMFFSFGNSQGSYLSLGSQSLTNLWLGNGSGTYTGNFNFSLNTWYWFVVQYDGSAVKVYVDRQLVVQGNFTPNYVGQDLQFGNLNLVNNQDNTFIGYLDEFRWSKGLRYPTGVMEIPTQPFGSSQARFKVAAKGFVPSDSRQLLPANPSDYDLAIYRVFPEEAAPQNLTSATSDPNWEVTWSGAYSGRVGWQAFDSDQGTTWCTYSAAVGDWLCWEYKGTEGSVLLRRYSIAKGSGNGDCPTGWKIQGSNDGSTWVDLDEQTGQSFPDNNAKEYTIPNNSTPYKFHRFYLLSWNTSNMIGTFKAWSWINSTEERKVWLPINKSEFVVADARLLPDAPSDTTNSYWLNSGPVTTQVSPASYAGSTDATWTVSLSGTFEGGDVSTLFDSDTTNGVSGTIGLETHGAVQWVRKDQVPYQIDQIVLRVQTSDIGSFPQTIYLIGYDVSVGSDKIVQEFLSPVWETESDTSTYATSFTRVCTLEVNAPAFQSYDYSIALAAGAGIEVTLQAFAAYQLDTDIAWKQLNTATTTTAGLMAAADKVKLDALQQAATYINIATDFNTYKTAGSYFLKGAVHTNGPLTDSYAGTLVVVAPAELRYTTQYFTQLYTNKTFVRTYSRDNSAWSAWNRVIVDTDLATTTVAGLMAAADKAAIAGLTANGIYPNARTKAGAVDFNEVIDHGMYFIGGDAPHLNYPETYQQNGGTLQVIRYGNTLTQMFIPININKAFIRSCLNGLSDSSERTFSAWRRQLIDTDITESKARPGYFKLPGGTIVQWGAVSNITADGSIQITFPVAFPNASLIGNATTVSGNASASGVVVSLTSVTVTGMTLIIKNHPGNSNDINVHWLAIGY